MTYLQLVNSVLRKLREDEVTTVSEDSYSKLIGDLVNDAKRYVEDAWDWRCLKQTHSATIFSGNSSVSLNVNARSKIMYVYNTTSKQQLQYMPWQEMQSRRLQGDDPQGPVQFWTVSSVNASGPVIDVYPTADADTVIQATVITRTDDLSGDGDTTIVPNSPIVQLAFSYALRERGETGGQTAAEQAIFSQQELSNSIALDAALNPDESVWTSI